MKFKLNISILLCNSLVYIWIEFEGLLSIGVTEGRQVDR